MSIPRNVMTPGHAATWLLKNTDPIILAESPMVSDCGGKEEESIFSPDLRCLVDASDYQDGGKYRSIVKIQARFNDEASGKSVWMMGTGWLIRNDLVVTAGHVVYDWGHRYGPATEIKCYIGYNGRAKVATTTEWLDGSENRHRDVAFIQTNKPFTGNLQAFLFPDTPTTAQSVIIGVVGYPGDKCGDEHGAQMYEQFTPTDYNLESSRRNMLEYKISTFGGQSGAPVIRRRDRLTVIGTHCYGGGSLDSNSGNAIGGPYGNNYGAFLEVFNAANQIVEKRGIIDIIKLKEMPIGRTPEIPSSEGDQAENFLDVLRQVTKMDSKSLSTASSLIGGPIGGVIGTAAGTLLATVAEAESMISNGTNGYTGEEALAPGAAERAVLAEAALQAVLSLETYQEGEEIFEHMERNWDANAPDVDTIAIRLAPYLTECALDIAVDKWNRSISNKHSAELVSFHGRRPLSGVEGTEAYSTVNTKYFTKGLLSPTIPVAGEEGVFDILGSFLKRAIGYEKPLLTKATKAALTEYVRKLLPNEVDSESLSTTTKSNEEAARLIFKRAVMADAALQALISLPEYKLRALELRDPFSMAQEVNVFDWIKTTVQKIGPVPLNTAKAAARKLAPVLLDAALNKNPGEDISLRSDGRPEGK